MLGDAGPAGGDGVPRRWHADPAARGRPGRMLRRVHDEFGLARGAEVTTEANPDSVDRLPRAAARGRLQPGLVRHAVRGAARAGGAGPHPRPGAGAAVVAWARAAGFEQVSLDLIYGTPGESSTTGGVAGRGAVVPTRPRLGLRADRRGRAPRWPAGSAAASCRCPTTTTSPTSTSPPTAALGRRAGLVRGVELGPHDAARCRHNLGTGAAPTGGGSARARTPRRRCPVVERQAPGGVRRRSPPGQSRPRPRGARPRDPPGGAGPARDRLPDGLWRRARRHRRRAGPDRGGARPGRGRRASGRRPVLTPRAGCSADAVVRDLLSRPRQHGGWSAGSRVVAVGP